MIIREVELSNVRGISHLHLRDLPDRGVVVLSGENESGKTTIAEAIFAALTMKWSSGAQEARKLHAAGSTHKPEVRLGLVLDGYEFTITKIFGTTKGSGTIIDIHEPTHSSLRDDQAEEWLKQRLTSADTKALWSVFVAAQGKAPESLSLGSQVKVTSALQTASGQAAETTAETTIFDAVAHEYGRYFTKTGKANAEVSNAKKNLEAARNRVAAAKVPVTELQRYTNEAGRIDNQLLRDAEKLPEADREVERWSQALAELAEFRVAVEKAEAEHQRAAERYATAEEERSRREAEIAETSAASEKLGATTSALEQYKIAADREAEKVTAVDARLNDAEQAYKSARRREDSTRAQLEAAQLFRQVTELGERVAELEVLQTRHAEVAATIAANAVDDDLLESIQAAHAESRAATAVLQAHSPTATIRTSATTEISIDGRSEIVAEAEPVVHAVTTPLTISVGEVDIVVAPPAEASQAQQDAAAAKRHLLGLLEQVGVETVEQAQQRNSVRRRSVEQLQEINAKLLAVAAGSDLATLKETLTTITPQANAAAARWRELSGQASETNDDQAHPVAWEHIDIDQLREKLAELEDSRHDAESQREQADAALKQLSGRPAASKYSEFFHKAEVERAHAEMLAERLAAARESTSDAAVFAAAANRAAELEKATAQLGVAQEQLARKDADDAEASLAGARSRRERLAQELRKLETRRSEIRGWLEQSENANEELAAAEGALERQEREYSALMRRAHAAQLLYQAMVAARKDTRDAIAQPLLEKLDHYGGSVFGPGTKFAIDENLTISSRTNDSGTFDVDVLSGGAQEQLDILLRLAAAGVMEGGQGAPVIIDDALGYSDPDRLRRMNNAISRAGRDMQVLVLTCDAARFDLISDARHENIHNLKMG